MAKIGIEQARQVKSKASSVFAKYGRVVGIGITRVAGNYAVKVNLAESPDANPPTTIDGVPIKIEITGRIQKRTSAS